MFQSLVFIPSVIFAEPLSQDVVEEQKHDRVTKTYVCVGECIHKNELLIIFGDIMVQNMAYESSGYLLLGFFNTFQH